VPANCVASKQDCDTLALTQGACQATQTACNTKRTARMSSWDGALLASSPGTRITLPKLPTKQGRPSVHSRPYAAFQQETSARIAACICQHQAACQPTTNRMDFHAMMRAPTSNARDQPCQVDPLLPPGVSSAIEHDVQALHARHPLGHQSQGSRHGRGMNPNLQVQR
jgi:hypothetical protein